MNKDESLNIGVEQLLWGEGHERVAGVDEAGRGAIAGPITAAAVILPQHIILHGVKDSKKLTPKKCVALEKVILEKGETFVWSYCANYIDTHGIERANCSAMTAVIKHLRPDAALIDGKHMGRLVEDIILKTCRDHITIRSYDKGESKSQAIAAASILAKTYRDRIMRELDKQYPQYGFATHKGYGTEEHRQAIWDHGFCAIHRKTFRIKGLENLYK